MRIVPILCPRCAKTFRTTDARDQHARDTHDNPDYVPKTAQFRPDPAVVRELDNGRTLRCPTCGKPPALSKGQFGLRADCCGLWSWGGKPLVDRATHAARVRAHKALDAIWQSGRLSRNECYQRLAAVMGMTESECHIAYMSAEQAVQVAAIAEMGVLHASDQVEQDQHEQAST